MIYLDTLVEHNRVREWCKLYGHIKIERDFYFIIFLFYLFIEKQNNNWTRKAGKTWQMMRVMDFSY